MKAEQLRKLASDVRQEDARRQAVKRETCAQIIIAAEGLELLRRKLGGSNVG